MAKESIVKEMSASGPRSLSRVMGLFDRLAKRPEGMTLAGLSDELNCPKSSLLNLFRPLVADGNLLHTGGIYRLGPSIFRFASNIVEVWDFAGLLHPFLVELAQRSHETAYLGVLDREAGMITCVDAIDSKHSIRYSIPIGTSQPLYCTAAGRVLLAHYEDQDWVQEYLRTVKLERLTKNTLTDRRSLRKQLVKIRETGVAVSIGELFEDSAGIASPVFGVKGRIAAALAAGAPVDRLESELDMLIALLSEIASRASGQPLKDHKSETI